MGNIFFLSFFKILLVYSGNSKQLRTDANLILVKTYRSDFQRELCCFASSLKFTVFVPNFLNIVFLLAVKNMSIFYASSDTFNGYFEVLK